MTRMPGPANLTGSVCYVQWVATELIDRDTNRDLRRRAHRVIGPLEGQRKSGSAGHPTAGCVRHTERVRAREPTVRLATVADSAEIIRLAAIMYDSMGIDAEDAAWRRAARTSVKERLGHDLAAAVADHPDKPGYLLASGAGCITSRLPGPTNLAGTVGYIQWVATEPEWRGQGLARAIMARLLDWCREREVVSVELHATPDAEHLYRSLGFGLGTNPGLRLRTEG